MSQNPYQREVFLPLRKRRKFYHTKKSGQNPLSAGKYSYLKHFMVEVPLTNIESKSPISGEVFLLKMKKYLFYFDKELSKSPISGEVFLQLKKKDKNFKIK